MTGVDVVLGLTLGEPVLPGAVGVGDDLCAQLDRGVLARREVGERRLGALYDDDPAERA